MFSSASRSLGNLSKGYVGNTGEDIYYKVPLPSTGVSGSLKISQAKDLQEATQKVINQQNSGKIPKGKVSISEVVNPVTNKKEWLASISSNKMGGKSKNRRKTSKRSIHKRRTVRRRR